MPDLLKEFLTQTDENLADLEKLLPGLEQNPEDEKIWESLAKMFTCIRGTASFLDFNRSYALADAALADIKAFKNGQKGLEVLPPVLMKFQRIKKIISSATMLGREPRNPDDDLLPLKTAANAGTDKIIQVSSSSALLQTAKLLSEKEKKINALEIRLDEREEELVTWSQSLAEEENSLKERENKLFEGEKRILVSENDLSASLIELNEKENEIEEKTKFLQVFESESSEKQQMLSEQENRVSVLKEETRKIEIRQNEKEQELKQKEEGLFALEEELTQNKIELRQRQEDLKEREALQSEAMAVLETKENDLNALEEELHRLESGLEARTEMNSHLETELRLQIQQQKQQLVMSSNTYDALKNQYDHAEEDISRLAAERDDKMKECQSLAERLNEEKEITEKLQAEWAGLVKQYHAVNEQVLGLQNDLSFQTVQARHAEKALQKQTELYETLQDDLKSVSWPVDVAGFQRNITELAKSRSALQKYIADSLNVSDLASLQSILVCSEYFKEISQNFRSRSFRPLHQFLQVFIAKKAEKYQRRFTFTADYPDDLIMDIETENGLRQILTRLADNSLRYAVLHEAQDVLSLHLAIMQDGEMLRFEFSDNGTMVAVNEIRNAVLRTGFFSAEDIQELPINDLMQYLLHPLVMKQSDMRGLLFISRILEKSGGRIKISIDTGFLVSFAIPRRFLFGQVLVFSAGSSKYAVPLSMVEGTVSLNGADCQSFEKNGNRFMEWKGGAVPFIHFPVDFEQEPEYGLILQAGAFTFVLPVDHIFDAEQIISINEKTDKNQPFFIPCVTLEGGREIYLADMSFLLRLQPLPLPGETDFTVSEKPAGSSAVSYLIFKSSPNILGAVPVENVERIDAFDGYKTDEVSGRPVIFNQEKILPLHDYSSEDGFPYARAVLILNAFAEAIQEVVDIADIASADIEAGYILFEGKKIPVMESII